MIERFTHLGRSVYFRPPKSRKQPLVVCFHDDTALGVGVGKQLGRRFATLLESSEAGFLFPEGFCSDRGRHGSAWSTPSPRGGDPLLDVRFIDSLVDTAEEIWRCDPDQATAVGFGVGATFTYWLSICRRDLFARYGFCAQTPPEVLTSEFGSSQLLHPDTRVSYLFGTADHYPGGNPGSISHEHTLRWLRERTRNVGSEPAVTNGGPVETSQWPNERLATIKVTGLEHEWPSESEHGIDGPTALLSSLGL